MVGVTGSSPVRFTMFYKWVKYCAAHTILKKLYAQNMVIIKVRDKHMFSNRFNGKFSEHKKKISFYSITTLKDAAWLLYDTKEIDIFSNPYHQFDIELKNLPYGIKAMNEKAYVWKVLETAFFFLEQLQH